MIATAAFTVASLAAAAGYERSEDELRGHRQRWRAHPAGPRDPLAALGHTKRRSRARRGVRGRGRPRTARGDRPLGHAGGTDPLGVHAYLRGKDLALFGWMPPVMPDPKTLNCHSTFTLPNGTQLPEFDRFALFSWDEGLNRVGKNMARVLAEIGRAALNRASK